MRRVLGSGSGVGYGLPQVSVGGEPCRPASGLFDPSVAMGGGFSDASDGLPNNNAYEGEADPYMPDYNAIGSAQPSEASERSGVLAASAVAQLVVLDDRCAGFQLGTVPSWASARECAGHDGKSLVLPINFPPWKVGGWRQSALEPTERRGFCHRR